MKKITIEVIANISLILFVYILVYFFYIGIITTPTEGDSLLYHIPIAKFILNGSFINIHTFKFPENLYFYYYPGSSEALLSLFMFFHIPLNLYNVFAVIILFLTGKYLAKTYGLDNNLSTIYASTICTLDVVLRWISTQKIDIWLVIYFMLGIILLKQTQTRPVYFIMLGAVLGMLIGTKYSGLYFVLILFIIFYRQLLKQFSLKHAFYFLIPFSLVGLSWYLRNLLVINNPIYPQSTLFFEGINQIFSIKNWHTLLHYPEGTINLLNAMIAEYRIWFLTPLLCPLFLVLFYKCKSKNVQGLKEILFIGLAAFVIYLILPSGYHPNETVSFLRYSYPAYFSMILGIFLIAKHYKAEVLLSYISIASMFMLQIMYYYPKLTFLYIPIAIAIIYKNQIKIATQKMVFNALTIKNHSTKRKKTT